MNKTFSATGLIFVLLLSGMLPIASIAFDAYAQQTATASDNPIRTTDASETPPDSVETDAGDHMLFSHVTDEYEINETESYMFYFDVNSNMLGSTAVITLDIVDKLFDIEPDLDLTLYDTEGELADFSHNEGDETEIIIFEFNQTGIWYLDVEAYEGDGFFVLYRDVYSNSPPEIVTENLNTDNPFLYDPVIIDACDSYDPDSHDMEFYWYVGGVNIQNDVDSDGVTECEYEFEIDSLQPITVRFDIVDEYGLSSDEQITITPSDPGWNVKAIGETIAVDVDEAIQFTFYDMSPPMQTPIRSDDMPVVLQVGLKYDIIIESDFAVQMEFDQSDDSEKVLSAIGENIDHYEQNVFFKPSLVFILHYGTTEYSLDIPMLSNSLLYASQPFFTLENYSSDLFYWADYIEIDTIGGFYEFISYQEFNLASIDLYPILEWMIDNLAAIMGQGWVETATNLLSKLVDIAIPLEFNVDITAYGLNLVQAKPMCDSCTVSPFYINGPPDTVEYSSETEISYSSDYNLKVAMGVLSYFYVEATPNIDISLEVNDIRIWSMELFEFEILSNEYVSSNPSGSHVLFEFTDDSDNDGVGNAEDFLPNDPSQQYDSDNDGCGDNSSGTNGDQFPNDPSECEDSDLDGVGDNADKFPNDANETMDSDEDGVGDNADAFPNDANETTDSDGDGVGDNSDAHPNDPAFGEEDEESDACVEWEYWNPELVDDSQPGNGCPHYVDSSGGGETNDEETVVSESSEVPFVGFLATLSVFMVAVVFIKNEQEVL
jgi:hypothetical protein